MLLHESTSNGSSSSNRNRRNCSSTERGVLKMHDLFLDVRHVVRGILWMRREHGPAMCSVWICRRIIRLGRPPNIINTIVTIIVIITSSFIIWCRCVVAPSSLSSMSSHSISRKYSVIRPTVRPANWSTAQSGQTEPDSRVSRATPKRPNTHHTMQHDNSHSQSGRFENKLTFIMIFLTFYRPVIQTHNIFMRPRDHC